MPAPPFRDNNAYGLTNEDLLFLKRLARDYRHNPIGGQGNVRLGQPTEMNSPYLHGSFGTEHYVIQVIDGYVPAAFQVPPLDSGDVWRVVPGVGFGQVYSFVQSTTGTADGQANGAYVPVFGFVLIIDNLSTNSVPENAFCEVTKDKYGRWTIHSVIATPFTGTGTGTGTGPKPPKDCNGCGWPAGLIDTDCLAVFLDGTDIGLTLQSPDGGVTWGDTESFVMICGNEYTVKFLPTTPSPSMTLTRSVFTGTGSHTQTLNGHLDCCACTYATFAFPKSVLCPSATPSSDGPCHDTVKVTVEWASCVRYDVIVGVCCPKPVANILCVSIGGVVQKYTIEFPFGTGSGAWVSSVSNGTEGGKPTYPAIITCLPHDLGNTYVYYGFIYWDILSNTWKFQQSVEATQIGGPSPIVNFCPDNPAWTFTFNSTTARYSFDESPYTGSPIIVTVYNPSTCVCTPIAGWTRNAWYCATDTGASCTTAEPVYIDASNKCNGTITICSGPYDTEAEAMAACSGGIKNNCCPGISLPTTFTATCTSGRTATLVWDGSEWAGPSSPDSNVVRMFCEGGVWKMQDGLTFETVVGSSLTCSPFSIQFIFSGGGGFTWTVTG